MRWVEVLGEARVLVVTMEEMAVDPTAVLDRCLAFLGLCPYRPTYMAENVRTMQVRNTSS